MKTIKLTKSYEHHDKAFDTIVLREPKYKDLVAVGGEVWEVLEASGGKSVLTHYDRLDGYVNRLVIEPPAEALSELSLADAMKLENAVGGFFTDAIKLIAPPTPSSGAPENPLLTSVT